MPSNLSQILIASHLAEGEMTVGEEIGIKADQVLLEDVLGPLVMLELEAMNADRVKVEVAVQYVDHNLLEVNNLNAEEHLFLRSACQRYGVWYSRPGTGISHPTHMQRFGKPGKSLVGCDSHTAAAGGMGMFAVGTGGADVAVAMTGGPFYIRMPEIWGVHLSGSLPDWVSAKDVILEMLRRHGVEGGFGRVIEYYGPGLTCLSAMDRHVLANMGAEFGATTTVFPSDARTREFLANVGREEDWSPLAADEGATYDHHEEIDLGKLEPLIATPSSPGNVVRVRDVPKLDIFQAYIGSSANPGYRDYAVAAAMVEGQATHDRVSFDINPSTRQVLEQLTTDGHLAKLVDAGARVHQPGCNGCIGMGQAPARGRPSLRTVPRNFPGRSGTLEDAVYLCSPETAAASALTGRITDPRDLELPYPKIVEPRGPDSSRMKLSPPIDPEAARGVRLEKTPNIMSLPELKPPAADLDVTVLLKVDDNISTDDITPAGRVLPYWANIPKVSEFTFRDLDNNYHTRAGELRDKGHLHAIIAGHNYGQGSSRENAALAPRYLGLGLVVAKSFARIHWQNLINFGILPLTFKDENDAGKIKLNETLRIDGFIEALGCHGDMDCTLGSGQTIILKHDLSPRQIEIIKAGSVINRVLRGSDRSPTARNSSETRASQAAPTYVL